MATSRPPAPIAGDKFRILVVEGDLEVACLILTHMERAGFDARHVPDGALAVEVFSEIQPHILLLDIDAHSQMAHAVCARIHQTSSIPILMLTARGIPADVSTDHNKCADEYIIKPFNPRALTAQVISWLRKTYHYDFFIDTDTADLSKSGGFNEHIPRGWVSCDSCNYMGPRQKFETVDPQGNRDTRCPNCKKDEFVTYSLG